MTDLHLACPGCAGKGRNLVHVNATAGHYWQWMDCKQCNGEGSLSEADCDAYYAAEDARKQRKAGRLEKDMSSRELARKIGVKWSEVVQWEQTGEPAEIGQRVQEFLSKE